MSYKDNYNLIDWSKPLTVERKKETPLARSDLPFPRVMSDAMDPVQSQASGKFYDSKSAIRAEYKRLGMVEVGNDPARFKPRPRKQIDHKQIKTTLEKAEARFNRGERVNRTPVSA